MGSYRVLQSAGYRIDDIYLYTAGRWGEEQADAYIEGMFKRFQAISDRTVLWRVIPAEFGVKGFYALYEQHFIYWKEITESEIGIVAVLHKNMDRANRLKEDAGINES